MRIESDSLSSSSLGRDERSKSIEKLSMSDDSIDEDLDNNSCFEAVIERINR